MPFQSPNSSQSPSPGSPTLLQVKPPRATRPARSLFTILLCVLAVAVWVAPTAPVYARDKDKNDKRRSKDNDVRRQDKDVLNEIHKMPREEAPRQDRETSRAESRTEARAERRSETRTENRSETRNENRGDARNENRVEARSENRVEARKENSVESRAETRNDNRGEARSESRNQNRGEAKSEARNEGRSDNNNQNRDRSENRDSGSNSDRSDTVSSSNRGERSISDNAKRSDESSSDRGNSSNGSNSDRTDSDGSDRNNASSDRSNTGSSENQGDNQEPASSVVEWLQNLTPSTPQTETVTPAATPSVTPTTVQPTTQTQPQTATQQPTQTQRPAPLTKATNAAGRRVATAGYEKFDFENGPRTGVLALNLDKSALDRAQAKGFKVVETSSLSKLDVRISRLVPPAGMSVAEAEFALSTDVAMSQLTINQKYRLFKPAVGSPDHPQGSPAPVPGEPACEGDHCFGRELIGWQKDLNVCAKGLAIGVVDTAVDVSHPTFDNKSIELRSVSSKDAKGGTNWHGTGVLALLAGDAKGGIEGLIPDARFLVADVFFADGDGQPATDTLSLLRALEWLREKDVKIINMSLSGPPDVLLKQAIERMSAAGVVFVAAAGNEGPGSPPSYPAAYPQVLAVTAIGKDLRGYRYANQGEYIDMAAPGVAVWTALPGAKQGYHSGTSFATPYATAAVAALYGRLTVKSKPAVLQGLAIQDIGPPGRDTIYGKGLLQAPELCSAGKIASAARPKVQRAQLKSPALKSPAMKSPPMALTSAPAAQSGAGELFPWLVGGPQ
jgi:hypothetical protein